MLNLQYDYGANNNGQVQSVRYYTAPGLEDTTKSQYFTYDLLGRLTSAHTGQVNSTAATWALAWSYDRWGNRLSQTLSGGNVAVGQPNLTIDSSTNRITNTGVSYEQLSRLLAGREKTECIVGPPFAPSAKTKIALSAKDGAPPFS